MKRKQDNAQHVDSSDESSKKVKTDNSESPSRVRKLNDIPEYRTNGATHNIVEIPDDLETTPFVVRRSSLYVPLFPIGQQYALASICAEHLSPFILTYYPPLKGVLLAFENSQLSNEPTSAALRSNEPVYAKALDEYGASYVWVTADFLLFAPQRDQPLEGWISSQNESHVGLIVWNYFNASISRDRLPTNWTWLPNDTSDKGKKKAKTNYDIVNGIADEAGFYADEHGNRIEGSLKFRVADIDLNGDVYQEKSLMSIQGTLLSTKDEAKLREQKALRTHRRKGR